MQGKRPGLIEIGFRRGWADAVDGHSSQSVRFHGEFLTGYYEGYRRAKIGKLESKTLEQSFKEWRS